MFEISAIKICLNAKFGAKKKSLNLERKMYFLNILGLEFENNIVIFKVSALEFVQLQNFVKK